MDVCNREVTKIEGEGVFVTEVVADSVQFLEPKDNNNGQQDTYQQQANQQRGRRNHLMIKHKVVILLQMPMDRLISLMMIYLSKYSTSSKVRCLYDWLDKTSQKNIRFTNFSK